MGDWGMLGRAAGLATAIGLASLTACGRADLVPTGDALAPGLGRVTVGGGVFPPGTRIGSLGLPLRNVSSDPIELVKIELPGRGLGRTVRVVKVEVSPNLGEQGGPFGIPGGGYLTDPPVSRLEDGLCHVGVPQPVRGFLLGPGAVARVWVVLEWGQPGPFLLGPHIVYYLQDGSLRRQTLAYYHQGRVDASAKPPRLESWERPCLLVTTLLNPRRPAA